MKKILGTTPLPLALKRVGEEKKKPVKNFWSGWLKKWLHKK